MKKHSKMSDRELFTKMIDELVALAIKMQNADNDLLGRSARMRELEANYVELRNQVLARMSNKQVPQPA